MLFHILLLNYDKSDLSFVTSTSELVKQLAYSNYLGIREPTKIGKNSENKINQKLKKLSQFIKPTIWFLLRLMKFELIVMVSLLKS